MVVVVSPCECRHPVNLQILPHDSVLVTEQETTMTYPHSFSYSCNHPHQVAQRDPGNRGGHVIPPRGVTTTPLTTTTTTTTTTTWIERVS